MMKKYSFYNKLNIKEINYIKRRFYSERSSSPAEFSIACKNNKNKIIGGAIGFISNGKICTDILWVEKIYRINGIGRLIMNKIHYLGTMNNCRISSLAVMSFRNALGFYIKMGYKIDFERKGYPHNNTCFFLSRSLPEHRDHS